MNLMYSFRVLLFVLYFWLVFAIFHDYSDLLQDISCKTN